MTRILVVEDDRTMRELLALHLGGAGYDVATAEDPIAAGDLLTRARPDLIISDINMPRLSGLEFISLLRHDPAFKSVPIIILSTVADVDTRRLGPGTVRYLSKPVRADSLLSTVANCVQDGLLPIG